MSTRKASTRQPRPDEAEPGAKEQPGEERAEETVERVAGEIARFARRLVASAREEVEDIVAEAQTIRRGNRPRG